MLSDTLRVGSSIFVILGAYMTYEAHEDGNQQDMLSTSSLRRKLFFHGDTSSLAPSPVKYVQIIVIIATGSPEYEGHPTKNETFFIV